MFVILMFTVRSLGVTVSRARPADPTVLSDIVTKCLTILQWDLDTSIMLFPLFPLSTLPADGCS